MDKKTFRKLTLARRAEIYNAETDKQIITRFIGSDYYKNASCIFLYVSFDTEIHTHDLIRQALADGKRVVAPICRTADHTMELHEIMHYEDLVPGYCGIPTPPADSPEVTQDALDLVILPGMAFDTDGSRMGFGGGYYDRFIESLPDQTPRVALVREAFVGPVPTEAHDQKADVLITEDRILETPEYLQRRHDLKQDNLTDTADHTKAFIASRGKWGMRLGLETVGLLLDKLGNPERDLKYVHVAGTNGKGSVCTMLTEILVKSGYKTGTYMSPALESFNERIRLDTVPIPDDKLIELADRVKAACREMVSEGEPEPTGFEIETAIAFLYFKEAGADICVFEVGLGGRLDATNIIPSPEAAVITRISLEHTEYLGDTVEKIAGEKAGIIKNDCSVIIYPQKQSVENVIAGKAHEAGAREIITSVPEEISCVSGDLFGQQLIYNPADAASFYGNSVPGAFDGFAFTLKLAGAHQQLNCLTVLKTVGVLRRRGWKIPDTAIQSALETVVFPGRMELLCTSPVVLIDGAHNPNGIQSLAQNIERYFPGKKITLYFGMLADKDIDLALDLLLPCAGEIYTLTPDSAEAVKSEQMARRIREKTGPAVPVTSLSSSEEAVRSIDLNDTEQINIFTGSLYMIGHIRSTWNRIYPH
ncbi:MAG: 5-formyltetrahydrofolate cyclo-ligase [Eubacteriaceae bacterium]|jgi:dihydrofolate synthase/folylpolyglutamate synthase